MNKTEKPRKPLISSALEGNKPKPHISVAPMMDWTNTNNKPLKLNKLEIPVGNV